MIVMRGSIDPVALKGNNLVEFQMELQEVESDELMYKAIPQTMTLLLAEKGYYGHRYMGFGNLMPNYELGTKKEVRVTFEVIEYDNNG